MMTVPYPLNTHNFINPGMGQWGHDILSYPLDHFDNLPLVFYLDFFSKLNSKNDGHMRDSSFIGTLYLRLFRIEMPYSFMVIVIVQLLSALYAKKRIRQRGPLADTGATEAPSNLSSSAPSRHDSDIFPPGLDIYLSVSGTFVQNSPRGSAWYYYLLKNIKSVPAWVVPVLSLIVYGVNTIRARREE